MTHLDNRKTSEVAGTLSVQYFRGFAIYSGV